jgi:dynein heavy chain
MEAVMILRKADPTWAEAKRQLNDPNFLTQLIQYQIETLNDSMLKKIDAYP